MSGKRLNPQRRLAAQIASWDAQARAETIAYNDEPLQKGKVRSSLSKKTVLSHYAIPRDNWEGTGKRGSVSRGKFIPKRKGVKSRFGVKS